MAIRKGRKDAKENLENHQAIDDAFAARREMMESHEDTSEREFKEDVDEQKRIREEMSEGGDLHKMLGIEENLSSEQEASLNRLEKFQK